MEAGGWKRESRPLILVGDDVRSLKFSGIQLETRHLVSYGGKITLRLNGRSGGSAERRKLNRSNTDGDFLPKAATLRETISPFQRAKSAGENFWFTTMFS